MQGKSPRTRTTSILGIGSLFAVLSLALGAGFLHASARQAEAATVVVTVTSTAPFRFQPNLVTINVGDSVRWAPTGVVPHTITSDGCGNPTAGPCLFDTGTETFIQATGARPSFEYQFNQPGVFSFFCRLHGAPGGLGQSGTVVVQAPGQAPPQVPPPSPSVMRPPISQVVYAPREGQTIAGDKVTVDLGINGASVRPAVTGNVDPRNGHFHLFLDQSVDTSNQVPVGGINLTSRSFTYEGVAPGAHTLTVVWTYDNNISPQPAVVSTVRFTTVAAPAPPPSIAPPATGDGGLRASDQEPAVYLAAIVAGGMLLIGPVLRSRRRRPSEAKQAGERLG